MINLKHIAKESESVDTHVESSNNNECNSGSTMELISSSSQETAIKRLRPNAKFLNRYINQQEKLNEKLVEVSLTSAIGNQTSSEDIDLMLFRKKGESELKRMAEYYGFDISLTVNDQMLLPDGYLQETGRLDELLQRRLQQQRQQQLQVQVQEEVQPRAMKTGHVCPAPSIVISSLSSSSSLSSPNAYMTMSNDRKKRKDDIPLPNNASSSSSSSLYTSRLTTKHHPADETISSLDPCYTIATTSRTTDRLQDVDKCTRHPLKRKAAADNDDDTVITVSTNVTTTITTNPATIATATTTTTTQDSKKSSSSSSSLISSTNMSAHERESMAVGKPLSRQLQSIKSILNASSSSRSSSLHSSSSLPTSSSSSSSLPTLSSSLHSSSSSSLLLLADNNKMKTHSMRSPVSISAGLPIPADAPTIHTPAIYNNLTTNSMNTITNTAIADTITTNTLTCTTNATNSSTNITVTAATTAKNPTTTTTNTSRRFNTTNNNSQLLRRAFSAIQPVTTLVTSQKK